MLHLAYRCICLTSILGFTCMLCTLYQCYGVQTVRGAQHSALSTVAYLRFEIRKLADAFALTFPGAWCTGQLRDYELCIMHIRKVREVVTRIAYRPLIHNHIGKQPIGTKRPYHKNTISSSLARVGYEVYAKTDDIWKDLTIWSERMRMDPHGCERYFVPDTWSVQLLTLSSIWKRFCSEQVYHPQEL